MRAAEFTHIYPVHAAVHTDFYLESLQITPGFIETHGLTCGFCFTSKLVAIQNGLGPFGHRRVPACGTRRLPFATTKKHEFPEFNSGP